MKKKYLLIGGLALVFLVMTVAVVVFIRNNRAQKPATLSLNPFLEPTPILAQLEVWEDPAGFKFSYPGSLLMNTHPEDEENYANLELTATGKSGYITVLMKVSSYQSLEAWLKKEASGDAQVLDSQLGAKPAKKVAYNLPKRLVTAALDAEALVTIEGVFENEPFWQNTYNQIISSFEFTPLAGEKESSSVPVGDSSAVIEEPEEIVE